MPGSPGLQAISFNTSCEIEIADAVMQAAGQLGSGVDQASQNRDFAQNRAGEWVSARQIRG